MPRNTGSKRGEEDEQVHQTACKSFPPAFFVTRFTLGCIVFPRSIGFRTARIGPNTFVKCGPHIDVIEAETLRYIATHTSIPVPKVQRAWSREGQTFILMEFLGGVTLRSVWGSMSQKTQRLVIHQLKVYLEELRSLVPPSNGAVASVNGGPLRDGSRIGLEAFGPFQNQDSFHRFLRADVPLDSFGAYEGSQNVVLSHRQQYKIKFTHGDFAPRNILVKKDGTVVAIVDWDSAGWFPEYWEYTKARFTPYATDDWVSSIWEMTGKYEEQLAGERQLYNLCGTSIT